MEFHSFEHTESVIAALYLGHFGAAPTFVISQHYVKIFDQLIEEHGSDLDGIAAAGKALSEIMYEDSKGSGARPDSTNAEFVEHLYQQILGRPTDAEGLDYWVNELETGVATRGEIIAMIILAARDYERDGAYVENRAEVARAAGEWENSNPNILPWVRYDGVSIMEGVNEDPATVTAALDRMPGSTPRTGEIFELTPRPDIINGTDGHDIINAYWVNAEGDRASTLTAGDVIDGGAGFDVLNIYSDPNGQYNIARPSDISISNVEFVVLYNYQDDLSELGDVSIYDGLTALWQVGGASKVTNLRDGVTAAFRDLPVGSMIDVHAHSSAREVHIGLDHVSTALDDFVVRLNENDVEIFTIEIFGNTVPGGAYPQPYIWGDIILNDAIETLIFNSEVHLDINIFGEDETHGSSNLTIFDASGSSGSLQFTALDTTRTIIFGSGDDSLYFDVERRPSMDDVFDGGDGFDTLRLAQETFRPEDYAAIRNTQNFEQVEFLHNYVVFDASELADFSHLKVFPALGVEDEGRPWHSHAVVHNLSSEQTLTVGVFYNDAEDAGMVSLVNAADIIILKTEIFTEAEDVGSYLWIEAREDGEARDTLILSGEAWLSYDNRDGMFTVIDARELTGGIDLSYWEYNDDPDPQTGMAFNVQETVILGDGEDWITLGVSFDNEVLSSSTVGLMDVIEGFNSVVQGERPHDVLLGISNMIELELSDSATTLDLALEEAAAAYEPGTEGDINILFFHFEGDTYLYADTWTEDGGALVDDNDFAIQIFGIHDFTQESLYWVGEPFIG